MMGGTNEAVPRFDRSRRSAPSRTGTGTGCSHEYSTRRRRMPRLRASLRMMRHSGQFTVSNTSANRKASGRSLLAAPMLLTRRTPCASAYCATASFAEIVSMASTT